MIRRIVKSGLAAGLRWSGASLLKRRVSGRSGTPWIVGYHRVVEDFASSARTSLPPMLISRAMLARHLDWMGRRYDLVSLDEIAARHERGGRFPRPAAAVTFDDGYHDVYELAFPLLKAKGIPAAVFVVTALVGTTQIPLFDRLHLVLMRARGAGSPPWTRLTRIVSDLGIDVAWLRNPPAGADDPYALTRFLLAALSREDLERVVDALETQVGVDEAALRERRPLTWDMLHEMRRSGITIGSHTRRHALLTLENEKRVLEETFGSRRDLEERLGTAVLHFAYPNGWFDASTVALVRKAGYRYAYTSCHHCDPSHPFLTVPRTLLWENSSLGMFGRFSPTVMGCQADGTFDRPGSCPLTHGN